MTKHSAKRRRQNRNFQNTPGTLRALPFIQNTQGTFNTVIGTVNQNVAYNAIASDLQSSRLVKLMHIRIDFAPTVSGSGFPLVQLFIEDPTTNILVPVSRQRALNMTTRTTIVAALPFMPLGFVQAGSGGTAFSIRATSGAVLALQYTLEARFHLARDNVN